MFKDKFQVEIKEKKVDLRISFNYLYVLDLKKDIQELYGLISFGVLRKKMRGGWYLSRDARKPVFGVSDQVRHKPACTSSEKS